MLTDKSKAKIENIFQESLADAREWVSRGWGLLKSYPLHFAVLLMAGFAVWEAHTPVTIIVPFQLQKNDLPFTGELVADAVQDGLKSIRKEIEEERLDTSLESSDTGLANLRNMLIPEFTHVQAPPRFSVEIKGVSYERVLSLVRGLLGTETQISGDVIIVENEKFVLVARAVDGGPWQSAPRPITAEALQEAGKDLAQQIVAAQDPTLSGIALMKGGNVDQGLAELVRARALNPSDERLKANLCMGFSANRRYPDAIKCYKEVLDGKRAPSQKLRENLAQAYYLNGDREEAIEIYTKLAHSEDYRHALLGLGEAMDDKGDSKDALKEYNAFLAAEDLDRNLAIAHVKKGLALSHLNRHGEAQMEYDAALKYSPRDILILVHRGLDLAEGTDLDAGIAQIQSAVNENQDSNSLAFARFQLGELLEKKGDWQGALDQYQKAALQRPTYVEAHLKLAHALVHERARERALEEYEKAAKLSALDLERGYSRLFANQWLGNELRDMKNYADAASAYEEAIHIKTDDSAAHCQLALILASQRHLIQAVHEYGEALVPAKLHQLNDTECLAVADHVLDHAVAGPETDAKAALAELLRVKEAIKQNPLAQNALASSGSDKAGVEQAVLGEPLNRESPEAYFY